MEEGTEEDSRNISFKHGRVNAEMSLDEIPHRSVDQLATTNPTGQVVSVRFRGPRHTDRTHYEVMCETADGTLIKFDFTMAGYRIIYDAEDRYDGLSTLAGTDVTSRSIMVNDAIGMFMSLAARRGHYREGANSCHSVAADFFQDLTGSAPSAEDDDGSDSTERSKGGDDDVKDLFG